MTDQQQHNVELGTLEERDQLEPEPQHPTPPNEGHDWDQAARDTYRRLRDRAESDTPPAWMPTEPGDELFGTLANVTAAAPTKFGPAPVVAIAQPSGEIVSVWLLHSVLRREFERAKPTIGETLLIRYLGTVQPEGDGKPYQSYALIVDRAATPVSWDEIAKRYDGEPIDEPPADRLAAATSAACPDCGHVNGDHADGCPQDVPF